MWLATQLSNEFAQVRTIAMADAPKSDGGTEAAPKKKGALLMIFVAVVALAAGGGGAYFFVGGKADKSASSDENGAEGEGKHKLPAQFVKLDPPFVVNFEAKGLMRFLQVSIEVMTRDPETVDLIKKNDPMIRNDLILLFGNQKYESISTREGKELLRAEALKVVSKVIGDEGGKAEKVEQLYFTSFVMQ
jgi:flagellar FliL protein